MVHILSGSVSFGKVPIPTCIMLWYHMEVNVFIGKYCTYVKLDTILHIYFLHLNQLACKLCPILCLSFYFQVRCAEHEHLNQNCSSYQNNC